MKLDGSNQIQLTTEDNNQFEPSFNDDGSMIVYESDEDGMEIFDIWTLDYTPSPNQPPSASVSANPTSGSSPLAVSFTGSGSDSDGSIASYSWDFGDTDSSSESSPSHTYQNVGSFTAILTVTDDEGATDTASIEIVVNEPEDNQPPSATADAYPKGGSAPLWVHFTGLGSDSDGSISSYSWDFGDGTSSTEQDPSHTYQNAGSFTATLTVTDDDGATGTTTMFFNVSEGRTSDGGSDQGSDTTSGGEGTSNTPGFSVLVAISAICVAATIINSRKKRRLNECDDINSV
jgi:PKD repeat protein